MNLVKKHFITIFFVHTLFGGGGGPELPAESNNNNNSKEIIISQREEMSSFENLRQIAKDLSKIVEQATHTVEIRTLQEKFKANQTLLTQDLQQLDDSERAVQLERRIEALLRLNIENNQLDPLKTYLSELTPSDDCNMLNRLFVYACGKDMNAEPLEEFLKYPEIDINFEDVYFGAGTALVNASLSGNLDAAKVLLKQPKIDLTIKVNGRTALEALDNAKSEIKNKNEIRALLNKANVH